MTAITNLQQLLKEMAPHLQDEPYVFISRPNAVYGDLADCEPIGVFMEPEGLSLIIPQTQADRCGLTYDGVFRNITLTVNSSLEAVGLTAAVSAALTRHEISANVVAATHHDHIFVPAGKAEKALAVLQAIGNEQT